MKNLFSNLSMLIGQRFYAATEAMNKHKKLLTFAYLFALITSCFPMIARAEEKFELWQSVNVVTNIIYTFIIVIGIIAFLVGVILMLISKFNEQAITTPLIFIGVGVGLILLRALIGPAIEKIAFGQMYPGHSWEDWEAVEEKLK